MHVAKLLNEHSLNKLLREYILYLSNSGERIPEWIFDVCFSYEKALSYCFAELNAESNMIVYGKGATRHAILHELEHLRSRHNELVKGYDEEFERFVNFYFIGFRTSGSNGLFLEEAFNELSARKTEMAMFGETKKQQLRLVNEYKMQHYYNFEIYTVIALCALLGVKVEDVRKMKFSGDVTGQVALAELVEILTGDAEYWKRMQEKLDDFELLKRLPVFGETRKEMQQESLAEYYKLAYGLIVRAYHNKSMSADEVARAIYLFEAYSKKAGQYCKFSETARENARRIMMMRNKHNEKLFANSERCVVKKEDEKSYAVIMPKGSTMVSNRVVKKIIDNVGGVFSKPDKYEMVEESIYGL